MTKSKKGLAALLEDDTPQKAPKKAPKKANPLPKSSVNPVPVMVNLKLEAVQVDPNNPRKHFDESEMDELIDSVRENGVLQPIIVRPLGDDYHYIIVAGERRYRAAKAVAAAYKHRDSIPAVIKEITANDARELQIIENVQRSDMHPIEEAEAFLDLKERNLSPEEIGAKVGKSVYYVRQRLKLNSLDASWIHAYKAGHLSHKDAIQMAQLNPDDQLGLYEDEYKNGLFELKPWHLSKLQRKLADANFDLTKDYEGLPTCANCQFNTGSSSLFPDDEKTAFCKNRKCFEMKEAYEFDEILENKKDDPGVVLLASSYDLNASLKESWKSAGLQVYKEYCFNELEEPSENDWDLDPEEYDEGANDVAYKEELERYHEAVEEYQKELKRPDLVKALIMSGGDKGQIMVGYMDPNPESVYDNQKDGTKEDASSDPEQNALHEIVRIEGKEKRSQEIDGEKVWANIVTLLNDPENRAKVFNDGKLTGEELYAAAYALCQKAGYEHNSWIREFFGDDEDRYTYEVPEEITSKMLLGLLRLFICDVLVKNYGSHKKEDSHAAIAFTVLNKYLGDKIQLLEAEQKEIADKRQARVNERIAALKKKIASD